jgi:signal transduction histidine kinase
MVGGVSILDRLERLPETRPALPVVLDLTWAQGSFSYPREVKLPPGIANLSVHIDAGSPNVAFPVRFEAKLDDPQAPWQGLEPGVGGIYYGGLSAGVHRLVFRSSLDGVDWRESTPLLVTIQPPWYLTLWAKALVLVLVLLAALGLVKHRLQVLERHNRELDAKVKARTRELEGRTQELAQRNQSMEWVHRELRNTLESRLQMINTVTHDLRSPLTSIRLSVDRLQEAADTLQPQAVKLLGIMGNEAQRLEGIIKGVLDRNRADALADRLSLQIGTPRMILEGLEATLALKAESLGLQSHLNLDPEALDAPVLLDPAAMQQVLFNLLENALKFTPRDGKVGVRSSLIGPDWVMEIWDTGRGIPKDQCERLFQPFQQGQVVDARQGWGLGLYICRSIVEAHGGRIEVESIEGEGSAFRVMLPVVQPKTVTTATLS